MRRCCWKVRGVLALAVVPVVALSTTGAAAGSDSVLSLTSLRTLDAAPTAQQSVVALPRVVMRRVTPERVVQVFQ